MQLDLKFPMSNKILVDHIVNLLLDLDNGRVGGNVELRLSSLTPINEDVTLASYFQNHCISANGDRDFIRDTLLGVLQRAVFIEVF